MAQRRRPLRIGLLNNMPDGALAATERQFRAALERGAGGRPVEVQGFALPGVPRGEVGARFVRTRHAPAEAIASAELDALVVTGAEPVAPELSDEPFWPALTAVIDGAAAARLPTLFSCLAAHAAVLHLHGLRRRRLPAKCSGVFLVETRPHPLTAGQPRTALRPHSRWNALDAAEVAACGLQVIAASPEVGADAFTGGPDGRFLFLQGHPEYAADTLMLEFRRDLRRFLTGERPAPPARPTGYFTPKAEAELAVLDAQAGPRPTPAMLAAYETVLRPGAAEATWASSTDRLFAAWLDQVEASSRVLAAA